MTKLVVQALRATLAVSVSAPARLVAATEPPLTLKVAPIAARLAVTVVRGAVLTAPAAQGPGGPPGPKGDTGPTGTTIIRPERAYQIAVATGQTLLPISPPPTDLNGFALVVNGIAYGPPNSINVSAVAVTWLGAFPLDPSDDVRVRYF